MTDSPVFVREGPDGLPSDIWIREVGSLSVVRGAYQYVFIFGDAEEINVALDVLGLDSHLVFVNVPPGRTVVGPIPPGWGPLSNILFGVN